MTLTKSFAESKGNSKVRSNIGLRKSGNDFTKLDERINGHMQRSLGQLKENNINFRNIKTQIWKPIEETKKSITLGKDPKEYVRISKALL